MRVIVGVCVWGVLGAAGARAAAPAPRAEEPAPPAEEPAPTKSELVVVTDAGFSALVQDTEGPLLVFFSSPWAVPCKVMHPIVEQVAQAYRGRVTVGILDIDAQPETSARLGIRGIPAFVAFSNGREVGRQIGSTTRPRLESLVMGFLRPVP